jgi:hypothetical protein
MYFWRDYKNLSLILCIAVGLTACFGGGGTGGNEGITPSAYTGVTTQATLDAGNVEEIVLGAYEGGGQGSNLPMPLAVAQESGTSRHLALAAALETAVRSMGLSGEIRLAATETIIESGSCGGSFTFVMNFNESTGAFSGSMNFNSYCEGGMTMNGLVSYSGSYSQSTQVFKFEMTFTSFSTYMDGETVTISGSMAMTFSIDPDNSLPTTFSI